MTTYVTQSQLCIVVVLTLLVVYLRSPPRGTTGTVVEPFLSNGEQFLLMSDNAGNVNRYKIGDLQNHIEKRASEWGHWGRDNKPAGNSEAWKWIEQRASNWGHWGRDNKPADNSEAYKWIEKRGSDWAHWGRDRANERTNAHFVMKGHHVRLRNFGKHGGHECLDCGRGDDNCHLHTCDKNNHHQQFVVEQQ
jgi:hypothetical protein